MATAARSSGGGPLTIRELQERRIKAEEALIRIELEVKRWMECDWQLVNRVRAGDERPLADFERILAECLPVARKGTKEPAELAGMLWPAAFLLTECYCRHRAVPLLHEAIRLLRPPKDLDQARILLSSTCLLGQTMSALGRLEEAETAFLDALEPYKLVPCLRPLPSRKLAELYLDMGRPEDALGRAVEAQAALDLLARRGMVDAVENVELLAVFMDVHRALEHYDDCIRSWEMIKALTGQGAELQSEGKTRINLSIGRMYLEAGHTAEAEERLGSLIKPYLFLVDGRLMRAGPPIRMLVDALRLLVTAKRALGKEEEARALEADLDETQAILNSFSDAALFELREEMQAERATGAGGDGAAAAAAAQPQKKKLSRKQQKRKAAQRRKAEARAAAVAEETGAAQGDEEVDAVAAAWEEQQLGDDEPEPEPEPEPEEPDECAICLGGLPAARAEGEGAVLLACSHVFHADCLDRWKDKCLEKGLRFTCAMCRATVVVASGAGGRAGREDVGCVF